VGRHGEKAELAKQLDYLNDKKQLQQFEETIQKAFTTIDT